MLVLVSGFGSTLTECGFLSQFYARQVPTPEADPVVGPTISQHLRTFNLANDSIIIGRFVVQGFATVLNFWNGHSYFFGKDLTNVGVGLTFYILSYFYDLTML